MNKAYISSVLLFLVIALIFSVHPVISDTSGSIVRSPDFDGDGIVTMRDVAVLSKITYSTPEDEDWDPRYDINSDGCINIVDRTLMVNSFGVTFKNQIGSFGWHSDNWSWEEKNMVYEGLVELPDIFVSRLDWAPYIPSLHESQPGKRIIIYCNFRKVDRTHTENWASQKRWRLAEYEFARDNDIICNDSRGNYVYSTTYGRNYLLADIGNWRWQQFIADWIKFYVDNYELDGVFLDNGLSVAEDETYWGVSSKPINPKTGTYYTDDQITLYHLQLYKRIREAIGDSKLIICNGIFHGQRFLERKNRYLEILNSNRIDGFMSEGIFGSNNFWERNRWLESVKWISWLQDNWLNRGKIIVPHINMHKPTTQTSLSRAWVGFEAGYSLEHSLTYHFASILLGIKENVLNLNFFSSACWWEEQTVRQLHSLDLGDPLGPMLQKDGTSVYTRAFEKGLVLVNPAKSAHRISLSGTYQTLDGEIISGSCDVRSFEGVILLDAS